MLGRRAHIPFSYIFQFGHGFVRSCCDQGSDDGVVVKMLAYVPLGYLLFLSGLSAYRYFKEKKNDDQIDAAQIKQLQKEILTSDEGGK